MLDARSLRSAPPAAQDKTERDDATRRRPALQRIATLPDAPTSKRGSSDPGRAVERGPVLVLASDRVTASDLARALIREEFAVRIASDATELLHETSSVTPCAIVLSERTSIDMPRPLAALLRGRPEIAVVVHGCVRAVLAEATLRALGAKRVLGIEGSAAADVVSALCAFFPER